MKASTFFLGLVAGSVAAAVTVLYSTPQSGNELRKTVKNASTDMKDKFKDVKGCVDDLKDSISHLTQEAKVAIPVAIEGIKGSVEQWQQATDPNKERMEKEIVAIQKALEELEQTFSAQQK
jgi:gas vesicle protein